VTRGRRPNLPAWLDLLQRLGKSSVKQIAAEGPYTPGQLRHYIREMVRLGYIEPARLFSHLPTDGPGAKRYVVTRRGRSAMAEIHALTAEVELRTSGPESSAGVSRLTGPISSQRFLNVHNLCFRMVIEAPFERPFGWAKTYAMNHWVKRHSPFGRGVHLEESGGRMGDEPGSAGHVLTLKFKEKPEQGESPLDVDRRAESRALGLRETLELRFGCRLSEPVRVGAPKHSFAGDPYARAVRAGGVTIPVESRDGVGVDDTPEPATLEIADGVTAKKYVDGISAVPDLKAAIERMETASREQAQALASIARTLETQAMGQVRVMRQLEEIRRREPAGPAQPKEN
jgi:hypothetical protein